MITVCEAKTKKQQKEFIEFPLKLYKGNKNFVPPLYGDELNLFNGKSVYSKICDDVYFNAYRDGIMVGRISGILQKQSNEIRNEKRVRFTRFDSIDDVEVATALFNAVEDWAKSKGMDTVCGPLGFSDLEREGLLIEGFDELSTFEEQYNYGYYGSLIEANGYEKEVDWVEYKLSCPKESDDRLARIGAIALKRNNLHIGSMNMSKRAYIDKYKQGFFTCLDECYKELYGVVPFTDEMKKQLEAQFMLIVAKKYFMVICDENERVVAFGLCFPSISKAVQKSGGRLTPMTLIKLFHAIKHPKILDLGLVAVLPEYQKTGVNAVILNYMREGLKDGKVKYCETNLNLEDNSNVQSQWKHFDAVQHKRRRAYMKKL